MMRKFLAALFKRGPEKKDYQMVAYYGDTDYTTFFRATEQAARDRAKQSYAGGNADFAVIQEKINGEWTEVFRFPPQDTAVAA